MSTVEYTGTSESAAKILAMWSTDFDYDERGNLTYKGELVPVGVVFTVEDDVLTFQKPYK